MVFLKIEAYITYNSVESISTSYVSFPDDKKTDEFIKKAEAHYLECRKQFKKNKVRKPIFTKIADLPEKHKAYIKARKNQL